MWTADPGFWTVFVGTEHHGWDGEKSRHSCTQVRNLDTVLIMWTGRWMTRLLMFHVNIISQIWSKPGYDSKPGYSCACKHTPYLSASTPFLLPSNSFRGTQRSSISRCLMAPREAGRFWRSPAPKLWSRYSNLNSYWMDWQGIHGPGDFGDPLTFHLVPPWGWCLCYRVKCLDCWDGLERNLLQIITALVWSKFSLILLSLSVSPQQGWIQNNEAV